MRRVLSLLVVAALAGAGVWAYLYTQSIGNAPKYKLARVEQGPLTAAVSATGNLNAVITVQAGAQFDSARAREQALAAAIQSAIAQLRAAEAMLESARAQVEQKDAALKQAQVDLDHTTISAPVDGVVVSRQVDVGQTVAASLQAPVLFTIAQDLTKMQVETSVDEADIGRG